MPPSIDTVHNWHGRTMVDPAGDKLGTIDAIYLDNETVTDERQVGEEVRKEQIEVEGDQHQQ